MVEAWVGIALRVNLLGDGNDVSYMILSRAGNKRMWSAANSHDVEHIRTQWATAVSSSAVALNIQR
jgi:hypothetical protein